MKKIRRKFTASIHPVLLVLSFLFFTVFIQWSRKMMKEEITQKGISIARVLSYSSTQGLIRRDDAFLESTFLALLNDEDVVSVSLHNEKGEVLICKERDKVAEDIREEKIKLLKREGKIYGEVSTPIGEKAYEFIFPLAGESSSQPIGYVRVVLSLSRISKEWKAALMLFAVITFLFLFVSMEVSGRLVRKVTKPVDTLMKGVEEISKGNFNFRIPLSSTDEIGRLAKTFNLMAENLQKSREEIEKYNKRLEEIVQERTRRLRETQSQLYQAGKLAAVGEMAAGVAHEMKNPLGAVVGFTQLALKHIEGREELKDDDIKTLRDYLRYIEKNSERCKEIVKSLLKFSRAEKMKFVEVNVNTLIEETLQLLNHQLELSKVEVTKELNWKIPPCWASPNHLQQVFLNIILNAQQAMPDGGKLTIRTSFSQDSMIEITFTDTGCGIPEENLEKIFEPFFTTREPGVGTGLGLSISYRIVEEHGGKIKVRSKLGEGSTFTILLPIHGRIHRRELS